MRVYVHVPMCMCVHALVCEPMCVYVQMHLSFSYKIPFFYSGDASCPNCTFQIMFSHFPIILYVDHNLCYSVLKSSQHYTGMMHACVCLGGWGRVFVGVSCISL